MVSADIKSAVLKWMRFEKGLHWVATEAGGFSADVLGASETRLVECEVKVSAADLRNDLKKQKHVLFQRAQEAKTGLGRWHSVPNYFYFAVPESLRVQAVTLCNDHKLPYGILVAEMSLDYADGAYWPTISVKSVRPARRLHGEKPSSDTLTGILRRMGSELVVQTQLAVAGRALSKGMAYAIDKIEASEGKRK